MSGRASQIMAQIEARLAPAKMGLVEKAMLGGLFSGGAFKSAPLQNPPIQSGMTETLKDLKKIIMRTSPALPEEYARVPGLLRRLKHLLRVYYDAELSGKKTAEFKFCDAKDVHEIALDMHREGLYLQMMPALLRDLMRAAPDLEAFLFEDLDIGRWRLKAHERMEQVKADPESQDEDRDIAGQQEDSSQKDLAAFQMAYITLDVLVAFVIIPPVDAVERQRAEKAMDKLAAYSGSLVWRTALGSYLQDSLKPVYATRPLLLKFSHAGGLPGIIDDWAWTSHEKDNFHRKLLEGMPDEGWDCQTDESLQGIFTSLLNVLERSDTDVVGSKFFARIMCNIYTRYGIEPFARASTVSNLDIIFLFLYRRISRKPDAFTTPAAMLNLLKKYRNVAETTMRRNRWILMNISDRWYMLERFGCHYGGCPERDALERLKGKRVRGVRDPEVEARLYRWGAESKNCGACKQVSYCSTSCQKADWRAHKARCKASSAKEGDLEVEL